MRIQVLVDIDIPVDSATDEQINEWLEFQFGRNGAITLDNPLINYDIEAEHVSYR